MIVNAIFRGSNNLGYVNSETYKLDFDMDTERGEEYIYIRHVTKWQPGLYTLRSDSTLAYPSLKSFLLNWEVI